MRPNVSESRDHLQRKQLPDDLGLELNLIYEEGLKPPRYFLAASELVGIAAIALIAGIGLRYVSPTFGKAFFLALFTIISFGLALNTFIRSRGRPTRIVRAIVQLISGPVIWMLMNFSSSTRDPMLTLTIALPLAIMALSLLADRIANHAVCLHILQAERSSQQQKAMIAVWKKRLRLTKIDIGDLPIEFVEACRGYKLRFLILPVLVCPAIAVFLVANFAQGQVFSGMLMILTLLATVAGASLIVSILRPSGAHSSLRYTWDALASWFTYNRLDRPLLGIAQSPGGTTKLRGLLAKGLLLIATIVILPISAYFPIVPQAVGLGEWEKQYQTGWISKNMLREDQLQLVDRPRPEDLEGRQLQIYNESDPDNRKEYLDLLYGAKIRDFFHEKTREFVKARIENWFLIALDGVLSGEAFFLWTIFIAMIACLTTPALLFLSILHFVGGTVIGSAVSLEPMQVRGYRRPAGGDFAWDHMVYRIQTSDFERNGTKLRDHLFFGWRHPYQDMVPIHRDLLHNHCWCLGSTESGKTSRFLAPTMAQLIRLNRNIPRSEQQHSVVVFDLKGDNALRRGAELEARAAGMAFKCFSIEPDTTSSVFNPFTQSFLKDININQLTSNVLASLGLDYGDGYGTLHFSLVYQRVFGSLVESTWGKDGLEFRSFREARDKLEHFDRALKRKINSEDRKQASDLFTLLDELARVPHLNMTEDDDSRLAKNGIDFYEALEEPHVLYFYLPEREGKVIRRIATEAAFTLLDAAAVYKRKKGGRRARTYMFIDEFQNMAADHFAIFLTQARDLGIATILANQTLAQLSTQNEKLLPTVQQNTEVKVLYSVKDPGLKESVIESSGEALYEMGMSVTEDDLDRMSSPTSLEQALASKLGLKDRERHQWLIDEEFGYSEGAGLSIGPGIRPNDIDELNATPGRAIVHVTTSKGFTQYGAKPIFVSSPYHIVESEFSAREQAPWTHREGHTIRVGTGLSFESDSGESFFAPAHENGDRVNESYSKASKRENKPRRKSKDSKSTDSHNLEAWNKELGVRQTSTTKNHKKNRGKR